MTSRPITLSQDQVRAALDGRLSQVRIPIEPQPPYDWLRPSVDEVTGEVWAYCDGPTGVVFPYGIVGDRLTCDDITLELTGVRVERLQSIAECDCEKTMGYKFGELGNDAYPKFREWWDAQHGHRHPWASNPWVWVLDVKRV